MEPMQTTSVASAFAAYPLPAFLPGTPRPILGDDAGRAAPRAACAPGTVRSDGDLCDVEFAVAAATLASKRSGYPWGSGPGGAALLNSRGKLLGIGYTAVVGGVPWTMCDRDSPLIVHAAASALANCAADLTDGTIALTHFPCADCARQVALRGLSRVVYVRPDPDRESAQRAVDVLEAAFIDAERFVATAPVVLRCAGDA